MEKSNEDKLGKLVTGKVVIVCRNEKTGEVLTMGDNLVVNKSYENLAKLLGKVSAYTSAITKIAFGTGGDVAPVVTDVGITGTVVTLVATATYPVAYSVKFTATWDSVESSVADINEVGLFFDDNTLAARYTFGKMIKSVGWSWEIQWTLSYSV